MTSPALAGAAASPSVFRQSLPVLATSFINKCGDIGLALVPMLLVERQVATANASLVMGTIKGALLLGTFGGGFVLDRLGNKRALMMALILSSAGLGLLPFASSLVWLCVFGALGQTGSSMFHSPARYLLTRLVDHGNQREAMGWLRGALNCGQIVSYGIGAAFTGSGVAALMLFDSTTSLVAAGFASKALPEVAPAHDTARRDTPAETPDWRLFAIVAGVAFGFAFLFELFMVTASATARAHYGDEGLHVFSTAMLVNTVLCTLLAVAAARAIHKPWIAFPVGIALVTCGVALAATWGGDKRLLFAGAFVLTCGEIVYASLSQLVMIRLIPRSRREGSIYGVALFIQSTGRILGSALAFPLLVRGAHPLGAALGFGGLFVALTLASIAPLHRRFAADPL